MEEKIPTWINRLYYLVLVLVLSGLGFSYLLPFEQTLESRGEISFLAQPAALAAPLAGSVKKVWIKPNTQVKIGDPIFTLQLPPAGETIVPSPVEGVLAFARELAPGDQVGYGERLALIYPSSSLGLKMALPQSELSRIKTGLPVRVMVDAYPSSQYGPIKGTVKEWFFSAGQMVVLIEFNSLPDGITLLPGMTARVDILQGSTRLLTRLLF
ncbi:MAG: HlyD family efflux transporter periplasmic adaptor subunit [Bacillota bacterium]